MNQDHKPELLAPAGTLDAVDTVLKAGADAVYIGTKKFNMRQHRSSYNFSDDDVKQAIELAHQLGNKIYITINNLIYESELDEIRALLKQMRDFKPDALIVQDIGVASIAREICVEIPLHASTMMNIHSTPAARTLKMMGFSRVITSRDITLKEVQEIGDGANIETEYFVHGDMCVAQSSQCLLSGITMGQSSNRGRCMKPCRWDWQLEISNHEKENAKTSEGYLLARKDMCMLDHISELVKHKVSSLKIEGRMRTADFLGPLIGMYRKAIDDYFANPENTQLSPDLQEQIMQHRVREYTTSHAFGRPQADSVDISGKREPRFFSYAAPDPELETNSPLPPVATNQKVDLIVRAVHLDNVKAAIDAGADAIYFGGDDYPQFSSTFDMDNWAELIDLTKRNNVRCILMDQRIDDNEDIKKYAQWLKEIKPLKPFGVGVSNLGTLDIARQKGFRNILADFSLHSSNSVCVDELSTLGVNRITASLELNQENLHEFLQATRLPVDVIVHGPLDTMLLEYCVIKAALNGEADGNCANHCKNKTVHMIDSAGNRYPVQYDKRCRNHIFSHADLCLLPQLPTLLQWQVKGIRIESQFDSPTTTATTVKVYKDALDVFSQGQDYDTNQAIATLDELNHRPLFSGAFVTNDII